MAYPEAGDDGSTEEPQTRRPTGMKGFTIIWFGQLVSLLGTGMTQFAITIWAWQATGEATTLALVALFTAVPQILTSPLAGAIVDRWDRKHVMMLSDLAAGIATAAILLLHTSGNLQIWHLYVTAAFTGAFQAFQFPAYSAAVSTMLPKEQYGTASGMISLAEAASGIVSLIAAAGGNLLGGYIYDNVSHTLPWWLQIVFVIPCILIIFFFVKEPKAEPAQAEGPPASEP